LRETASFGSGLHAGSDAASSARKSRFVVRIAEIAAGSLGEALELRVGTRILKVNGERVRDSLDFAFRAADGRLELETVCPAGEVVVHDVERDLDEPLGIVPDRDVVRECANACVFCFVDGNPPDARAPLWLRDDDFRLSFTYGSYVTLTNLGPRGLQRLVDQRISPLYVSVHATDPAVRNRLLGNDRAAPVLDQLGLLLAGRVEVHAQVVLCPGWNDGAELDRTIRDLYALGDGVLTLSVVPVGLTRHNVGRPVRLLTAAEARQALAQVGEARKRSRRERGGAWCYAADEMFLIAGQEPPALGYYDDAALAENGVGALRTFLDDFDARRGELRPMKGVGRVRIATGGSMAPFMERVAPGAGQAVAAEVEVVTVTNRYFGPTVTVAGLLGGRDLLDALGPGSSREGDVVLLPGEALNADDVFIDGLPLVEAERQLAPARVRVGTTLVDAMRGP